MTIHTNGIQAVLFDLDGTLRHNRPASSQVFFDFAVELGAPRSREGQRKALQWQHAYFADSPELRADEKRFADDESAFWHNFARHSLLAYGCPPDQSARLADPLHRRMREEYQPEDWVPEDVSTTLKDLQAAGFTLGVVSNRDEPLAGYLESIGICEYLDFSLAAGEVASWKPSRRIFQRALELSTVEPRQALYVGDNYYADVVGAQRAGLQPVLIDPEGIFPDARCPVIHTIGDVLDVIADLGEA
jgi:FMN phosphatase YigB (HAD superfamily)